MLSNTFYELSFTRVLQFLFEIREGILQDLAVPGILAGFELLKNSLAGKAKVLTVPAARSSFRTQSGS